MKSEFRILNDIFYEKGCSEEAWQAAVPFKGIFEDFIAGQGPPYFNNSSLFRKTVDGVVQAVECFQALKGDADAEAAQMAVPRAWT